MEQFVRMVKLFIIDVVFEKDDELVLPEFFQCDQYIDKSKIFYYSSPILKNEGVL